MAARFLLLLACSALPFAMAGGVRETSTALFAYVSKDCSSRRQPNFVFSPYSILGVFHAAQRGAEGETQRQMNTLVAPDTLFTLPVFDIPVFFERTQPVKVETANRIYAYKALEGNKYFENFKQELKGIMDADAMTLDFSKPRDAANAINGFLQEKTHGHIDKLLDSSSLSPTTKMVLVNALYFKAPWKTKFDAGLTHEDVFHAVTSRGPEDQRVSFMRRKDFTDAITYLAEDGVRVFTLPFLDKRLRLFIYLPDDMNAFEGKIAKEKSYLENLSMRALHANLFEKRLDLTLPKFKLSAAANRYELSNAFKGLGAKSMFDPARANFAGMSGRRDLYVSSYLHMADFMINEEGTEAAAASAVVMMGEPPLPIPPDPLPTLHLKVDKPFLFELRFDTNSQSFVLFAGRVTDVKSLQQ